MSNWEIFADGVKIAIFGMGVVFVFLVAMIVLMRVLQILVTPIAGRFEPAPKAAAPGKTSSGDSQLAAAAAAAVDLFRKKH